MVQGPAAAVGVGAHELVDVEAAFMSSVIASRRTVAPSHRPGRTRHGAAGRSHDSGGCAARHRDSEASRPAVWHLPRGVAPDGPVEAFASGLVGRIGLVVAADGLRLLGRGFAGPLALSAFALVPVLPFGAASLLACLPRTAPFSAMDARLYGDRLAKEGLPSETWGMRSRQFLLSEVRPWLQQRERRSS